MLDVQNIIALRAQRQFLSQKANKDEYDLLYRDMQPGQNVYWNGFGDPPSITFRADFNDIEYNRGRQKDRRLIKGRFGGGNLGWILQDDLELFGAVYQKPLDKPTGVQKELLELIQHEGPMNIDMMREALGTPAKNITPVLHRLQEAFLVYEDQYDGEWDRSWYVFEEMFPLVNLNKYTRTEALKILLERFAYRNVFFDVENVKSFYKVTGKDAKEAVALLKAEGKIAEYNNRYLLQTDYDLLQDKCFAVQKSIYVMHRNDFLVKSNEHLIKDKFPRTSRDLLQYILIDGEFRGIVAGRFKNGPYIIEDIILDLDEVQKQDRKNEIIEAVYKVNSREHSPIQSYCGIKLD